MFHLFGRHSDFGDHPPPGVSQHSLHPADSGGCRHGHQLPKKHFGTLPGGCTLGFSLGPQGGSTQSPLRKVDHLQKGVRKTPHSQRNVLQKNGSHSGASQVLSDSNALSQGLHRPYAQVCISSQTSWVGPCTNGTPPAPSRSFENKRFDALMGGRAFQGMCPVRFLHSDSSDQVWAGLDTTTNTAVQDFWRDKSVLHINVKELQAAVHTIKSLGKPKEHIHFSVDNSVAFAYLRRGGAGSPTSTTS